MWPEQQLIALQGMVMIITGAVECDCNRDSAEGIEVQIRLASDDDDCHSF